MARGVSALVRSLACAAAWMFATGWFACAGSTRHPPAALAPSTVRHDESESVVQDGVELIGRAPPPFMVEEWFNSSPLSLDDLKGRVVFVRWFMDPSCPFCSGTAPALRHLDERFGARGLVVIGMYHHKANVPLISSDVRGWIRHYGYRFPVAIDPDWKTLKRWWLDGHDRTFTSVSFLLDAKGVIRYIHQGGLIEPNGPDARAIDARVEALLVEAIPRRSVH